MSQAPAPLKLLVVEDSEVDFEILVQLLSAQGVECDAKRVQTLEDLSFELHAAHWHLVVCDHRLPGFTSAEALQVVRTLREPPPVIIVSGMIGEDAAVDAMRHGADDYLMKGRLARLGTAARNAVASAAARRGKAEAERRLQQSQLQLRNLAGRLQAMIDEERTAIARELHDEVGSALTAVRFDIDAVVPHLGEVPRLRLARAQQTLQHALAATRDIVRSLRPPILDAGLAAAIEWQLADLQERTGIATRLETNTRAMYLPQSLAMAAYRTCQEALTNVVRHARATTVEVELMELETMLVLQIRDDGLGLDPADLRKPGSLGLRGLKERAHAAGGGLDISADATGTTVQLSIPWPRANATQAQADAANPAAR